MSRNNQTAKHSLTSRAALTAVIASASVAAFTLPNQASASDVDVHVWFTKVPTIYVEAHDGSYTMLSPEKHNGQYVQFEASLDILGGQDRIRRWDVAPRMKVFGKTWGWSFGTSRPPEQGWGVVGKSYGFGDRPKTVRQNISMLVSPAFVKDFAVEACNANVAALRGQGKSNPDIFGVDRTLSVATSKRSQVTYTNIADTDKSQVHEAEGTPKQNATIVCMKTNPKRVPPPQNYEAPVTVTQSSLTIIEKATANGVCKVILSGFVQTNLANREVKFRYEHSAGNKSEWKTVSTDHSKTAFFSHEYDVPNNANGTETGFIRMVGTAPAFDTQWKSYAMACSAKPPGGLQSAGGGASDQAKLPQRAGVITTLPATHQPAPARAVPPQRVKTP
jgi:hypothetical protein